MRQLDPSFYIKPDKPIPGPQSPKKLRTSKVYDSSQQPSTSTGFRAPPPPPESFPDDLFESSFIMDENAENNEQQQSELPDANSVVPEHYSEEYFHFSWDSDFENRRANSILSSHNSENRSVPSQVESQLSLSIVNSQQFEISMPSVDSQQISQISTPMMIDSQSSASTSISRKTISSPIRRGQAPIVLPGSFLYLFIL